MSRYLVNLAIVGVIMIVMIVATTTVSATSTNTGRSGYPRSNRGFRNSQLSTARGFGKRDSGSLVGSRSTASQQAQGLSPNFDGFLPSIFDSSRTNYPTSWLVDELQNNPDAARFIVERLVDENGDGELTPGELTRRPNYY